MFVLGSLGTKSIIPRDTQGNSVSSIDLNKQTYAQWAYYGTE